MVGWITTSRDVMKVDLVALMLGNDGTDDWISIGIRLRDIDKRLFHITFVVDCGCESVANPRYIAPSLETHVIEVRSNRVVVLIVSCLWKGKLGLKP